VQRGIEAVISPTLAAECLEFLVEPNRSYRLQGSADLLGWTDQYFRLVTP
jgi:hypothetical protein